MKILIVTQTLDSKHFALGFFVRWVLEFARRCEQVTVFCLDKGEDVFPANVTVVHIPRKWNNVKMWPVTLALQAFVYRKQYTHVFAHMNPEYVLSAGLVWRILRKKIGLWYAHGSVTLRLKIATAFCTKIFSSTLEGFRYKTSKLTLVGQGIDTSLYIGNNIARGLKMPIKLMSIGRVSASKRLELLLETVMLLRDVYKIQSVCTIVGGPVTTVDTGYQKMLKDYVTKHNLEQHVVWAGPLPLTEAVSVIKTQDIFPHFGHTGSLDKAVLDAMVCGVIPLSTNEAVKTVLSNLHQDVLEVHTVKDVIVRIESLLNQSEKDVIALRTKLAEYTQDNFSLEALVRKIILQLQ